MRKIIRSAAVLAALLVWACLCCFPASAGGGKIVAAAPDAAVDHGGTFTVTVSLAANPGVAFLRLDADYDPAVLRLEKAENTGLFAGMFTTSKSTDALPYVLTWANASDSTGDGIVAKLTFSVLPGAAPGKTSIRISAADANNEKLEKIDLGEASVTVTVACTEHTGGKATCCERAICSVCGQPYGELGSHKYGTWTKEIKATCTEAGVHGYYRCSVCGKYFNSNKIEIFSLPIEPLGHSFKSYTYNGDADCTHDGTETGTCSRCGAKDTRTKARSALGHDYGKAYLSDASGHWRVCSRCGGKTAAEAHVPDSTGTRCSVCGYVFPVTPPVGHVHTLSFVPAVHASCDADGTAAHYVCAGCGGLFRDAAGTVSLAASELRVPAAGHAYGAYQTSADGHVYSCSACGETTVVPHAFDADGKCTECGFVRSDTPPDTPPADDPDTPVHEHAFSDLWSANRDAHWHECPCGERVVVSPHTPGPAATATSPQLCSVCGYILAPATGGETEPAGPSVDPILLAVALAMSFAALVEGAVIIVLVSRGKRAGKE